MKPWAYMKFEALDKLGPLKVYTPSERVDQGETNIWLPAKKTKIHVSYVFVLTWSLGGEKTISWEFETTYLTSRCLGFIFVSPAWLGIPEAEKSVQKETYSKTLSDA